MILPCSSQIGEMVSVTGRTRPSLHCRSVSKWTIRSPRRTRARIEVSSSIRSGGMMRMTAGR